MPTARQEFANASCPPRFARRLICMGFLAKTKRIYQLVVNESNHKGKRNFFKNWHYWKTYQVEAEGEVRRSEDETKQAIFYKKMIYYYLLLKLKNIFTAISSKVIGKNRLALSQFGING